MTVITSITDSIAYVINPFLPCSKVPMRTCDNVAAPWSGQLGRRVERKH